MTAADDKCDLCGRGPMVGVASIPSFPVSVAWCVTCLRMGAFPIWCVESLICDNDKDIRETIQVRGDLVLHVCADWFMDQYLVLPPPDGTIGPVGYVKIGDYLEHQVKLYA